MRGPLRIGDFELFWLNGGVFELDGGAMFGVVPKALWQKKFPVNADNYIPMTAWPILVKTPQALVLIESGLGNKLSEKQKKIYRVTEEWQLTEELTVMGIDRHDINFVILTHCDFDHAGGVVMQDGMGRLQLTFPNARHIIQRKEWEDVLAPNRRSAHSFLPINFESLKNSGNLELIDGAQDIIQGIRVVHTGGHNRGHQVVLIESGESAALHMGDLMPTHAHGNPLWIMAYDQFPLEVIQLKESWLERGRQDNSWFTFYHDLFVHACRFDADGTMTDQWPLATVQ